MNRKHWDPFREMEAMLRGWGSPAAVSPRGGHETMTTADWTPAVDIAETADEYLINVELTEVGKDDVKLSARDGVLTIEGQRRVEQPAGLTYHRLKRSMELSLAASHYRRMWRLRGSALNTARECSICTCPSARSLSPRQSISRCNRRTRKSDRFGNG